MAEFALGLTKTAVEGTLSRVKSAIDEEAKLRVRVQDDLVFITGEFQMMHSFLKVANAERAKNEVVRTWVRQIRDLAFDVEDCVEFVVHLDNKSAWSWIWRIVPSCMVPSLPLDLAVTEIQHLKARVEDVSQRNTRYNLIGDSGSDSRLQAEQPATTGASAFHILSEVWESEGKRRGTGDLKKLITSEGSDLQVISVWRSTSDVVDLGATYIIKKAYDDPEICREFRSRFWVKLMHPFNLEEFLKNLLVQFCQSSHHQANMKADFLQRLNMTRYLLVLEEISTVVEWNSIRMCLPDSNKGSRIVLSTQHLGLALSCTGEPYQVSELRHFSQGQSLCAFSKKGSVRRSDLGEFNWQIRCRGVITVLDSRCPPMPRLISEVYKFVMRRRKEFDGVVFEQHSWVDVPDPFNLSVFLRRLFLNFQSRDFQAEGIAAVCRMGVKGITERCCKYLQEDDCFVVINGLKFMEDWDEIKNVFASKPTKGCILIITNEASVAKNCVDEQNRAFDIKDVEADEVLSRLLKDCQSYGTGSKEDSRRLELFNNEAMDINDWISNFELVGRGNVVSGLMRQLQDPGVISVWGDSGVGKTVLVRSIYYEQLSPRETGRITAAPDMKFQEFSLVDVPRPFNLTDFTWRLLLGFYRNPKSKENAIIGLMEGQDPIEASCKFLCENRCFVVIDGLQSRDDWDLIRATLLSESTKGCIIVITNEASVATHCVDEVDRVFRVKAREADAAPHPLIESPRRGTFSFTRTEEARNWMTKHKYVRHMNKLGALRLFSHGVKSVWGIAGVGKSTLVRYSYYESILQKGFQKYSWVDVPHPFHLTEFSQRLLLDFHSDHFQAKENAAVGIMEGQDTIQGCLRFLRQDSYFVVIDGLRSTHDWDLIKSTFLSVPIKGIIVVITNEASIATHCAHEKREVINIRGLDANEASHLFTKITWGDEDLTFNMKEVSKLTVAKCGGLPKVITAVGEYLHKFGWALESLNADFMNILETNSEFHCLRGLFCWMQSYFDACPDSLKPCIFYLSVFVADHNIRRKRLLRRWIAEGYSRDRFGSTAEETGEMLFSELIKLSIIQELPGKFLEHNPFLGSNVRPKVDVCQVNGFFHGYIISRPMEDNLVFALEGRCSPNSQHAGQHLTVRSSWDRDRIVFESIDFTRLRSLTVFGEWRSFFVSDNMRLLRVLDLEDTSGVTDDDLEQIGKLLGRLKFLSLRGCRKITRLPKSVCGMRLLQTLDVRHTSIVKLPPAIIKLHKIQYIRAGTNVPSLEVGEGIVTNSLPAAAGTAEVDQISTPPLDTTSLLAAATGKVDRISTPPLDTSSLPAAAAEVDRISTPSLDTSSLPAAAAAEVDRISTPPLDTSSLAAAAAEVDRISTPPLGASNLSATTGEADLISPPPLGTSSISAVAGTSTLSWRSRSCSFVPSWFRRRRCYNGGAEVPAGIGKLTALHTLGVVDVGDVGGKAFLNELKELTQLRKLGLSGIRLENWHELCLALSGHGHLESLSVLFDKKQQQQHEEVGEFSCFDDTISHPPKTVKSLKMHGARHIHILPVWMKQLHNLKKADLEITILTQEDIGVLGEILHRRTIRRLCVKPIQDGKLQFGDPEASGFSYPSPLRVVEIDCRSRLEVSFGTWFRLNVEVLKVRCSRGSSLRLYGLKNLCRLKEVRLMGSYNDELKPHLQQQLSEHSNKSVKVVEHTNL